MRYRKVPKIVEAMQVKDIISGTTWPYWLKQNIKSGKLHVGRQSVNVVIGQQVKIAGMADWIAYDSYQQMVYFVSKRTMETDYEPFPENKPAGDQGTHQRLA